MNLDFLFLFLSMLYILCLMLILSYAFSCFILAKRFKRYLNIQRKIEPFELSQCDSKVLIQLPVYNEKNTIERLIDSVCSIVYPAELLTIEVLDDSTDETTVLIEQKIREYSARGLKIEHKKRLNRKGYKAGALKEFSSNKAEYLVIFDADFVPPPDFLLKLLPHFRNEKVGMVQSKWGHLNATENFLTLVQALSLNFHFSVEHHGRSFSNYLINFNGTAGIWRTKCIDDAGGWSDETLTEDLDLSFRAQMKGWKFIFDSNVVCDAELPPNLTALKIQQYRWNKGGAQCFKKLAKTLIADKNLNWQQKLFGINQLFASTTYVFVFILFILNLILVLFRDQSSIIHIILIIGSLFIVNTILLAYSYYVSWEQQLKNKGNFILHFVLFLIITSGLSFHNFIAVLSGYFSNNSDFQRTPKFSESNLSVLKKSNYFIPKLNIMVVIEFILSLIFFAGMINSIFFLDFASVVFFGFIAVGFGLVSIQQLKEISVKAY